MRLAAAAVVVVRTGGVLEQQHHEKSFDAMLVTPGLAGDYAETSQARHVEVYCGKVVFVLRRCSLLKWCFVLGSSLRKVPYPRTFKLSAKLPSNI